jgi:hypothetical protein
LNPGGIDPSTGHPTVALRLIAGVLLLLESPILAVMAVGAVVGALAARAAQLWRRLTNAGATGLTAIRRGRRRAQSVASPRYARR